MRYCLLLSVFVLSVYSCQSDDDASAPQESMEMEQENSLDRTVIPDAAFEAYLINRGADDVIDGFVVTENLLTVDQIVVDDLGITDLTGIQNCPNLYNLWLQNNEVSSLDVSQNLRLQFLYADGNNLTSLDVSNLSLLEKLSLRSNEISTINIAGNPVLQLLEVSGNRINSLTTVVNPSLFRLDVTDNPLECIEVNEDQLNNQNLQWTLDADDEISLDCI